jgi:hypothetical protein
MPSDLVGWAGFEPATSASRTGLQSREQVVYGLRSTGWRCLEPILRLVWRKDGGSPAPRVTDSPYVASILTSTHHETAKPEIKATVSGGGTVLPEGASNAYPMRFGTGHVQVLKTVRQLVQGVPSEGAAATAGARNVDSGVGLRSHRGLTTEG